MKTIFTLICTFFLQNVFSQDINISNTINGPEKYKPHIIQVFEKYDRQNSGCNIDRQLKEVEIILNQFMSIKRVIALNKLYDGNRKQITYTISFEGARDPLENERISWIIKVD